MIASTLKHRAPADGKFHLVQKGNIIGSFRFKKQDEQQFYQLVKESGYKPDTSAIKPVDPFDLALERYFQSKAIFWQKVRYVETREGKVVVVVFKFSRVKRSTT